MPGQRLDLHFRYCFPLFPRIAPAPLFGSLPFWPATGKTEQSSRNSKPFPVRPLRGPAGIRVPLLNAGTAQALVSPTWKPARVEKEKRTPRACQHFHVPSGHREGRQAASFTGSGSPGGAQAESRWLKSGPDSLVGERGAEFPGSLPQTPPSLLRLIPPRPPTPSHLEPLLPAWRPGPAQSSRGKKPRFSASHQPQPSPAQPRPAQASPAV